jgi:rhodanese-related sulfurtransferase
MSGQRTVAGVNSIIRDPLPPIGPPVTFLIENWYLFIAAAVSGGLLVWPMVGRHAGGAGKVTTAEAVRLINRERAVLIDISEPAEYAASHAGGAKNIPLAALETSAALPKNKSLPVLLICATGTRSSRAVTALKKLGFEHAHAVAGGLAAWREANLPVEKTA